MIAPAAPPEPRRRRLATVALLTAFAFGCTTVRAPVAAMQGPITIADGAAAPQLELWLESARPISPEEAASVSGKARAALEAALAGRVVGDGGSVLVVRAQGVTRTRSHKNDQVAATVGLVATAAVVVVALVLWLAADGQGGDGKGRGGKAGASPSHGASPAGARPPPPVSPAAPAAAARPVPAPPEGSYRPAPDAPRPPPVAVRPAPLPPGGGSPAVAVGVELDVGPVPLGPGPGEAAVVSSRDLPAETPPVEGAPGAVADPRATAELTPLPAGQVVLPIFPPFQEEERGFFDGDSLVLELTLVDRLTGEPRWTKWVQAGVDPLDQAEVRGVLDRALTEAAGWQPAR